ncbi:MAG: HEAT repeat domain-containing protein [Anaerolineae bacterium]|nr:HEAT repeat domain-containing protein [Anaerolineae bacterium]
MTDPLTGREPALSINDGLTGREPFIGGDASIIQALLQLDDADFASTEVLAARLAGVLPQLAALLNDEDQRKRSQAARLIGMVAAGHPRSRGESVPLLVGILDDAIQRKDRQMAGIAIDNLGETADPLAVEALLRVLTSDNIYIYRERLLASFSRLGMVALGPLLTFVGQDFNSRSEHYVVDALIAICRSTPEATPILAARLTPLLLSCQLPSDFHRILRELHSTPLVRQMIEAASDSERDQRSRRYMLSAASCIPSRQVTAFCFELLTGSETGLRIYAARALCRLRLREDIPRIIELIHHPDPQIRASAIAIAGKRKIKSAVVAILKARSDNHAGVRRRVVIALRRLRVESTIPALIGMTDDRSKAVRFEMVGTLHLIGRNFPEYRAECNAALQGLLADPDEQIRQEASSRHPRY